MNKKRTSWLAFSMLTLGQLVCATPGALAGGFDLQSTATTESDSKGGSSDVSDGGFFRRRFHFTFDTRVGYDDNTLAQDDEITFINAKTGKTVTRHRSTDDSAFLNFSLGGTYSAATSRSTLTVGADVGLSYFFDRPGRDYDVNGALTARFAYKLAPRLFLEASTYNAYISQGDYGASNLTNFSGSALSATSTPGTTDRRNGDYFYTSSSLQLTTQLAPRFSLVSGYGITAFAYDEDPYAKFDDRVEQFFSEEFRFLLTPTLTLAGDYRFGLTNYFTVNNDAYTHFVLGGVDYLFNPRLRASVRAGVEFRSYPDSSADGQISPYAEATVTYDLNRRANFALVSRYGIEEGGLDRNVSTSNTFRIGLSYNQQVTARISGYLNFYFTHSYFQSPGGSVVSFNEETYDVGLGARYAITRNVSVELGYTHTSVTSELNYREYDRNRVFGGIRLAF